MLNYLDFIINSPGLKTGTIDNLIRTMASAKIGF